MMANVKPWQYLMGVGTYVWGICMVGAGVMASGLSENNMVSYLCVMGIGFVISIIAGACIGMFARNQMAATSIVMPVMMILAFAPMLAMFNERIDKVAQIFYTEQLKEILDSMSLDHVTGRTAGIIMMNAVMLIVLFFIVYKRKGLE